jgi:MFS transporter, ACS family, solute carrier family 17 (sodium-dependent inorganic phosphate cotransporter), other
VSSILFAGNRPGIRFLLRIPAPKGGDRLSFVADWQRRYTVVGLSFLAVVICYVDRVNISVAIIPMSADLGWDLETRGIVLSSFFAGYLLLQIVGGRLADRFGGKIVLGIGVLVWSLFTLLTPPAAFLGLGILLLARIGMGMGEAVTFPAFYSLYGRWIPVGERARAVAFSNSGIPLGTILGLVVTPIIVTHLGWEWAFYLFGVLGIVWYLPWSWKVTASPDEDPTISSEEKAYIESELAGSGDVESPAWWTFLGYAPVWAIIVAHFCNNWSLYVLLSWLPTFVSEGLGVDFHSVGWMTMIPHLASFFFLNFAGNIADRLIASGMEVGRVRKLMQTIGFGGIAGSLLIVAEVESAWAAIAVMAVGSALGAFVTGGFSVNHMDIAPRHAGTLMGITNTAGTIPGIIGVYVSGLILQATGSWALVFQVTAGVTLFGLVFFLIFASGRRIFD